MTRPLSAAFALFLMTHATGATAQTIFPPIDPNRDGAIVPYSPPQTNRTGGHSPISVLAMLGLGVAGLALLASGGGDDTASGGGGGGGAVDPEIPAPTPPADPSPPGPVTPRTIIEAENEYSINPALRSARASFKYAQGYTGKGVVIGVLDSGIQDNPNLGRAVDRDHSYNPFGDDYVDADANTPLRHGTSVAQVIAGRRDGAGSHGLAYEATLLDLALANEDTDIIDPNQPQPSRRFAPAIQTGLGGGARLFNASFSFGPGTTDLSQTVDDFRTRFQQIGIYEGMKSLADAEGVLVVSTGNDSTNNPNLLATAGLMGEFSGHVIAVTSIDANDTISDFATRCSVLQEFCLAAVGENVPETLTNGDPSRFFGTSASAPVVTGAIALLKQEFPELSYPDTARIVLDTARDLGAPGTDAVYGRGALDLGNAFTPQGEIRIAAAYDVTGPSYAASESTVGAQDSMVSTLHAVLDDVRFMVYDGYTRGFDADLGSFVSGTLSDSPLPDLDVAIAGGNGLVARSFGEDGTMGSLKWRTNSVTLGYGRADLFAAATRSTSIRKGYSPLAAFEDAGSVAFQRGNTGTIIGAHVDDGNGFALWADTAIARGTRAGVGIMREDDHVLGTSFSGAMGGNGEATTVFADIATTYRLGERWSLGAQGVLAHTRFDQDGIFQSGDLTSASAEVSASYTPGSGNVWTAFAGTPLVAHGGSITLDLPSDRLPGTDEDTSVGLDRRQETVGVRGSSAPLDLGVRYTRVMNTGQITATGGVRIHDNDTDAFAGLGLALRF